jgi:hypothetical protein
MIYLCVARINDTGSAGNDMKSILEQLMDLTNREKILHRVKKDMTAGWILVHCSYLWRGNICLIEARGTCNVKTISYSIINLHNGSIVGSESVKHFSFTIVPEHDSIYKMSVTNESTHNDTGLGKVTISITKIFAPS